MNNNVSIEHFSDQLQADNTALWDACLGHRFVIGIGDGSLPVEKFKFYIRQDYVFLIDFCRVLALAVARADDLDAMSHYAALLGSTLNSEMELHRAYCSKFGISRETLETTKAAPVTHAYTRHLLHSGASGTLTEITAALVPCMYGYAEIGATLAGRGEPKARQLYGEWIRTYAAPEVQELAGWLRSLLDTLAAAAGEAERGRAASAYLTSSRYELLFWDAAYEMRDWLV